MSNRNDDFDWRKINHPIQKQLSSNKPFESVETVTPNQRKGFQQNLDNKHATSINLPPHLFTPEGAESLDIRVAADIGANTITPALLMSFKCPPNATCHFLQYAVFSDGSLAVNQEFIPRVDGNRVFPYQGDPNNNFKIDLGLAPDLSNNSLIQCQLTIQPNQTVQWFVKNLNAVNIAMGVRMVGYIDYSMKRIVGRVGG